MTTDEVNELLDAELKHRFVERGDSYQAYSSVICETPCTCLFIGRIDFLRIAPSALARSLFELIDDCYISEEDIGLEYREQNEWNDYKDKVMSVEYKGESFRKNH